MARQVGWLLALGGILLSAAFSTAFFCISALLFRNAALHRSLEYSGMNLYRQAQQYMGYAQTSGVLLTYLPFLRQTRIPFGEFHDLFAFGDAVIRRDQERLTNIFQPIDESSELYPLKKDVEDFLRTYQSVLAVRKINAIPEEKKASMLSMFNKLSLELGTLLSLTVLPDATAVHFYSSGIFQDLPVIPQIPAPPTSLEELRSTLQRLGGSVKIPPGTADPRHFFLDKIEHIRVESRSLQEQFSSLGVEKDELTMKAGYSTLEDQLLEKEHLITQKLQQILKNIARRE